MMKKSRPNWAWSALVLVSFVVVARSQCSPGTGYDGTNCTICTAGWFSSGGSNACSLCQPDWYSSSGSSMCHQCRTGNVRSPLGFKCEAEIGQSLISLSDARRHIASTTWNQIAFFGGGYSDPGYATSIVDIFDTSVTPWSHSLQYLGQARYLGTATTLGNQVIFAGGTTDGASVYASAWVDIYRPDLGTWQAQGFLLSAPRSWLASATVGSYAVFAGGMKPDNTGSNVVDLYNGTWSVGPPLAGGGRLGLTGMTCRGKAYFAGGVVVSNYSNVVNIFDGQFWSVSTISQPRAFAASACVANRFLYIAGGEMWYATTSNRIDRLDTVTGIWTQSSMTTPRQYYSAGQFAHRALFFGGLNLAAGRQVSIDVLNPAQAAVWTTRSTAACWHGSAASMTGANRILFAVGDVGAFSAAVDVITVCREGMYLNVSTEECDPCLPGTYSANRGAATCSSCPTSTEFGATTCLSCEPDYYNPPVCKFCTRASTCSGHGSCNALGDCVCDSGWQGPACNNSTTPSGQCSEFCTACSSGVCTQCQIGYVLPNCEYIGDWLTPSLSAQLASTSFSVTVRYQRLNPAVYGERVGFYSDAGVLCVAQQIRQDDGNMITVTSVYSHAIMESQCSGLVAVLGDVRSYRGKFKLGVLDRGNNTIAQFVWPLSADYNMRVQAFTRMRLVDEEFFPNVTASGGFNATLMLCQTVACANVRTSQFYLPGETVFARFTALAPRDIVLNTVLLTDTSREVLLSIPIGSVTIYTGHPSSFTTFSFTAPAVAYSPFVRYLEVAGVLGNALSSEPFRLRGQDNLADPGSAYHSLRVLDSNGAGSGPDTDILRSPTFLGIVGALSGVILILAAVLTYKQCLRARRVASRKLNLQQNAAASNDTDAAAEKDALELAAVAPVAAVLNLLPDAAPLMPGNVEPVPAGQEGIASISSADKPNLWLSHSNPDR